MTNRQAKISALNSLAVIASSRATSPEYKDKERTAYANIELELSKKARGLQATEYKRIAKKIIAE